MHRVPANRCAVHTRNVIVVRLPDRILADREALEQLLERPASTIRARCTPVAHDTETRRALYDTEQVAEVMKDRQRRHARPSQRLAAS